MSNSGKGDSRRPLLVKVDKFNENWDKIFSNKPVAKKAKSKRKGK